MGAEETLVISSWGGSYQKAQQEAFFKPFEKKTGVKVVDVGYPSTAKIKAMVTSGNLEWDIVLLDMGMVNICKSGDLLEKIDFSKFDKTISNEVFEGTLTPYAIGEMFYSGVLAYRTDVFTKEHPRSWKDFWDRVSVFRAPHHDIRCRITTLS